MLAILLVAAASIIPCDPVVRESVDLVEVNHFYDEQGRHIFDQIIFYDWSEREARYQVRTWRLMKVASQRPSRDHSSKRYASTWHDKPESGVEQLRQVMAASFRETWTQNGLDGDPELAEREIYPKEKRRELRRVGR